MTRRKVFNTVSVAVTAFLATMLGKAKTASSTKDTTPKSADPFKNGVFFVCPEKDTTGVSRGLYFNNTDGDLIDQEWLALPEIKLTVRQVKGYARMFKEMACHYEMQA